MVGKNMPFRGGWGKKIMDLHFIPLKIRVMYVTFIVHTKLYFPSRYFCHDYLDLNTTFCFQQETTMDKIHKENVKQGRDKYKTLREVRKGRWKLISKTERERSRFFKGKYV